ncbi:MAG TPA: transglutaminase-like domain-containing protein, partial [Polyangiaceae bacterium]|nr:transglutaminase-like domain-containing protein [Polyangiaceae bacterium]
GWWAKLVEPQLEATPAIKAKVHELTQRAATDEAKIKALYDFVAQDIRYRGLGVGPRTGYTPRKAGDTFTSRWGVCRDVAILLTSMLRESGIEAYPALTNMGDPVLDKVAYDGFNHAIVALPQPGGGFRYLDPTAKNNSALLPGYEAEQDVLVATGAGAPLGRIPALAPDANHGTASAESEIHADGSMTSKVKLETKGLFDFAARSIAVQMSSDQQRALLEEVLHHALPDAELVSFELSNPLALWAPMSIALEVRVPNAAPRVGSYRLAHTLVTSGALGLVENLLPRLLGTLTSRKYGLDAHATFEYEQRETVTLPAGLQLLALPNPASTERGVAQLHAECKQTSARSLECDRSFQLRSRFIDPSAYQELRGAFASLGQIAHQPIILTGGSSK